MYFISANELPELRFIGRRSFDTWMPPFGQSGIRRIRSYMRLDVGLLCFATIGACPRRAMTDGLDVPAYIGPSRFCIASAAIGGRRNAETEGTEIGSCRF